MYCNGKEDEAYLKCEKCGGKVKVGEHISIDSDVTLQRLDGSFYKKPIWLCKSCSKGV